MEEISFVSETVPEEQIEEVKEETQEAEEPEEPVEQEPVEQEVKRGRGRPKGALGKKKEKRNEDFILDVSFDEPKPSRKRVKKITENPPEEVIVGSDFMCLMLRFCSSQTPSQYFQIS